MKTKVVLGLAVCCLMFSLGGLVMTKLGQAQMSDVVLASWSRILWDYDSGWEVVTPGSELTLTHNLGGFQVGNQEGVVGEKELVPCSLRQLLEEYAVYAVWPNLLIQTV